MEPLAPPHLLNPSNEALQRTAFNLGIIRQYLLAYEKVMDQLEQAGELPLLVPVVNTLLERMHTSGQPVALAAQELLQEVQSERSKPFIMAAAMDVALNQRQPGTTISRLPTKGETYARA